MKTLRKLLSFLGALIAIATVNSSAHAGAILIPTLDQVNNIPRSGLLCEYRFDETSGTAVTDYSGNGNTGTYVGSPTMIAGGGFTSAQVANAATKYVTSTTGALATMQTLYIAADVAPSPNLTTFNTIVGNSTGATNIEVMENFNVTFRNPAIYSGTATFTNDTFPTTPVIITILVDGAGSVNDKIYLNGVPCTAYHSQVKSGTKRSGTLWIGGSSGNSHCSALGIYYFASYSTYQTDAQIAQTAAIMRDRMTRRGNPAPTTVNALSTTNQVLCYGDSITAGLAGTAWPLLLTLNVPVTVSNFSASGFKASDILTEVQGDAKMSYAPLAALNVAVVFAGTNDVTAAATQATVDTAVGKIRAICLTLQHLGWKVVVCTMIDRANGATSVQAVSNAINAGWRQYADECADLSSDPIVGLPGSSSNLTYFNADQLHPLTAGEQRIADLISAAINRMLAQDSLANPGVIFSQTGSTGTTVTNTTTETSVVGSSSPLNSGNNALAQTVSLSNATTTISSLTNTKQFIIGQQVSGTGITAGTTIATIPSSTSITISAATTSSTTNSLLTFGSIPMKGYLFAPGRSFRITQRGLMSTSGTPGTFTRKVKIGSTVFATTGTPTLPASITALPYVMEIDMVCVTTGATGTFLVQGELRVQSAVGSTYTVMPMTNASTVTLDTTVDKIMDITTTFSTASASNIDLATNVLVEQLN